MSQHLLCVNVLKVAWGCLCHLGENLSTVSHLHPKGAQRDRTVQQTCGHWAWCWDQKEEEEWSWLSRAWGLPRRRATDWSGGLTHVLQGLVAGDNFLKGEGQEGLGVWMESWSSAVFVVFVGQEEMRVAGGSSVGRGGGLGSRWKGELPLQWGELWTWRVEIRDKSSERWLYPSDNLGLESPGSWNRTLSPGHELAHPETSVLSPDCWRGATPFSSCAVIVSPGAAGSCALKGTGKDPELPQSYQRQRRPLRWRRDLSEACVADPHGDQCLSGSKNMLETHTAPLTSGLAPRENSQHLPQISVWNEVVWLPCVMDAMSGTERKLSSWYLGPLGLCVCPWYLRLSQFPCTVKTPRAVGIEPQLGCEPLGKPPM